MMQGVTARRDQERRVRSPLDTGLAPGRDRCRTASINGWLGIIRRLSARIKDVKKNLQIHKQFDLDVGGQLRCYAGHRVLLREIRSNESQPRLREFTEHFQPLAEFHHLSFQQVSLIR